MAPSVSCSLRGLHHPSRQDGEVLTALVANDGRVYLRHCYQVSKLQPCCISGEIYLCRPFSDSAHEKELTKHQAAASTFRIPYWDWASNPSMPDVVNQPKVSIVSPTGPQTIDNPLYQYKFHTFPLNPVDFPTDPNVAGDFWLAKYPYTVRGAATQGGPSNVAAANSALQNSQLMSGAVSACADPHSINHDLCELG